MSVGNIVVRLELSDGQFTAKMRKAGKTISSFSSTVGNLDKRITRAERGLVGFIPKLRDVAVIAASARVVIHGLSDTIGGFTGSVIKSNAEIERLTVLLGGISKAPTETGRIRDAANDIGFLFDMAQRAPFSIKELSNSFVKMKAAGIEDVDSKIQSLTDSIARFGGDEQTLHRATIAIQQMASKGVVSMEELRQQLGEAVPNAMNLMADGMGMTMQDMVKAISQGRVKAIPAIDAMMEQMNATMSGSSERMMETFNGLMSRLSTRWTLLQKEMGDAGFFEGVKGALRDLNTYLDSDKAVVMTQAIGGLMRTTVEGVVTVVESISKYSSEIGRGVKATLALVVAIRATSVGSAIFTTLTSKVVTLSRAWVAAATTSKIVTSSYMGIVTSATSVTTATTIAAKSMTRARIVMAALGGPINILIAGLTAAAAAWVFMGDKGSEAYDKLKTSREGLSDFQKLELNVGGLKDLEAVQTKIQEVSNTIAEKKKEIEREELRIKISLFTTGLDVSIFKKWKERALEVVKTLEAERKDVIKRAADERFTLINRQAKRQANVEEVAIRKSLSAYNQRYKQEIQVARGGRDAILNNEKSSNDERLAANQVFSDKVRAALTKQYTAQEVEVKSSVAAIKATLESLADSDIRVAVLMDAKEQIAAAQTAKEGIVAKIAEIEIEIQKTGGGLALTEGLSEAKREFDNVKGEIKSLEEALKSVVGNAVKSEDIIKAQEALVVLPILESQLSDLADAKDRVMQSESLSGDALIDANSTKAATTALGKMKTSLDSIKDRNAGLVDAVAGGNSAIGRQIAKMSRLALTAGVTNKKVAELLSQASKLLSQNRGLEATLEVAKDIDMLDGKIDRLRAGLNEGDPNATLIYKVKKMFDEGIIQESVFNKLMGRIETLNKVLDQKQAVKNGKWVADQLIRFQGDVISAQSAASTDAVAIEKFETDARIAELNRLADARKDLTPGLRQAFVKEGTDSFIEQRRIANAKKSADEIGAINQRTAELRIGLIDNVYERERSLLELSVANEKKKHQTVINNADATVAQVKRAQDALAALDDFRLASIAKIDIANKSSFETMLDDYTNIVSKMDEMSTKFVDGFTNSIADFVTEGKQTFGDFAASVIKDIAKMIIKAQAANLINKLLGRKEGEAAGGGFSGVIDKLFNTGSDKQQGTQLGAGDAGTNTSLVGPIQPQDNTDTSAKVEEEKKIWGGLFDFQTEGQNKVKENSSANWEIMTQRAAGGTSKMSGMMGSFVDMTIGGFAAMAANGKLSMASLLKTVLSAIAAMIIKYLALAAVKAIAGFAAGGSSSVAGGNSAGFSNSIGSFKSDAASGFSISGNSSGSTFKQFAKGGISTFAGGGAMKVANQIAKSPLMRESDMLKGGVKKRPHVALFAEASVPEAFIPMQDGKNVPLTISEDTVGNIVGNIPLPSGQILSTRIVSDKRQDASAFAKGGVAGSLSGSLPSKFNSSKSPSLQMMDDSRIVSVLSEINTSILSISAMESADIAPSSLFDNNAAISFGDLVAKSVSVADARPAFQESVSPNQAAGDVSININVDNSGKSDKNSSGNQDKFWDGLASKVRVIVTQEIAIEKRPGGLLS